MEISGLQKSFKELRGFLFLRIATTIILGLRDRNKTWLGIGHSFLARGQVVVGVDRLLKYGFGFVESLAFGFGGHERRGVGTEFPNLLVVTGMLYEEAPVHETADERIASGIGGRDRLRWIA